MRPPRPFRRGGEGEGPLNYKELRELVETRKKQSKITMQEKVKTIKKIAQYAWELKYVQLFTFFIVVISLSTQLIVPLFIGVVQNCIQLEEYENINKYCIIFLIIICITGVFILFRSCLLSYISSMVTYNLRRDLYSNILTKDVEFFDKKKTGDLLSRLVSDTEIIQIGFSMNLAHITSNLVMFLGSFTMILIISWKLTIIIAFVFIPMFFAGQYIGKKLKALSTLMQEEKACFSVIAEESVANIRTVKAFATENQELQSFSDHNGEVYKYNLMRGRWAAILQMNFGSIVFLLMVLLIYIGSILYQNGEITLGELTSFLLYLIYLIQSISGGTNQVEQFMYLLGACATVSSIFEYEPRLQKLGQDKLEEEIINGEIKLDHINFVYPSKKDAKVLNDIQIDIQKNKVIAIVGHSGSGKSSIISLIERFYDPNMGKISYDNNNIKDLDSDWYHSQLSFVQQEPVLFTGTIRENIQYGYKEAREEDIEEALKMSNMYNSVILDNDLFPQGLETQVGERGSQLSGGQKQRIAIARALVRKPKVLLLDEATSALDAESEYQVQQALDILMKQGKQTIIIVAHRLSTIKDADEIIVLDRGIVVERGTHQELLNINGKYKRLIKRQMFEEKVIKN